MYLSIYILYIIYLLFYISIFQFIVVYKNDNEKLSIKLQYKV